MHMAKFCHNVEEALVPIERNLYGYPFARLLCEEQFEKVLLETEWGKAPTWNACLRIVSKTISKSAPVRVRERHQNSWKKAQSPGTNVLMLRPRVA